MIKKRIFIGLLFLNIGSIFAKTIEKLKISRFDYYILNFINNTLSYNSFFDTYNLFLYLVILLLAYWTYKTTIKNKGEL